MSAMRLVLITVTITSLSGCTEMVVEGDSKVFQTSALGATIRTVIGLGLIVLAVVAIVGSVLPDRKPKNRIATAKDKLSSGQRIGMAMFGVVMGMMGLFLAAISLVFPNKLHVTVHPDRVEMASTFSQTGGKEVVVPFANVSSVEIRDEMNAVGKSKKHLVFKMKGGREIKNPAGNNELQSLDTITDALDAFKSREPELTERRPNVRPPIVNTPPQPVPEPSDAESPSDTKFASMPAPSAAYTQKRYPINIPIPDSQSPVLPDTVVDVGAKLKACYAGSWHTVTVVAVNNDGSITCNWDAWPTYTYHMLREDLTFDASDAR